MSTLDFLSAWRLWAVGFLIIWIFYSFLREKRRADLTVAIAVAVLLALGILTPAETLSVLSNSAPITIAALFVISAALERTGCIAWLGEHIGRRAGSSVQSLLIPIMLAGLLLSPFINNTPIVIMLTPIAISLARSRQISPSKVLIPLSYATILGGLCTMVGTSTNILVDGVAQQAGLAPFTMFEITLPAAVLAVTGMIAIYWLAPRLLPARETLSQQLAGAQAADVRQSVTAELIVSKTSRYLNRPMKDLDIQARYGIRVIAVHRRDANVATGLDAFELEFGDVLLIEGAPEEIRRFSKNGNLLGASNGSQDAAKTGDILDSRRHKAPIALLAMAGVMILAAFGVMRIEGLAIMAAVTVVATRCIDMEEAYRSIEWPILAMIFGMLALSIAMEKVGLIQLLASGIVLAGQSLHPVVILSLLFLITSLMTEVISNNAVAVLVTPVAIGVAQQLGLDPRPFVVAVMFAASASFATPIGYQTNTLVYNAGGYRFQDFMRLGIPMNILVWILASFLIPLFWPLQPS